MKTLVVSDLHSNHEALRAVLTHVRRKRIDRIVCLGDFVGYGAHPNQVLDRMRTFRGQKLYIRGNHDRVVSGVEDGESFNYAARAAALWTRNHLSRPNRRFLASLPVGPIGDGNGMVICHGSPFDEDEYVFNEYTALRIFQSIDAQILFFGHTHLPMVFCLESAREISVQIAGEGLTIPLSPEKRYLVNPGSVGQPRDRNPLSSFVIFDSKKQTIQFVRVPYDVQKTGQAILKAGLPRILADRLRVGT